ncbi:MAG: DUF1361 domain-containing protein [Saprospiraceae bacterium]|nr:DUF1361 domain-containing protein [Saprospiraceae bacterium]
MQSQKRIFILLALNTLFCFSLLFYRHYEVGVDLLAYDSISAIKQERGLTFLFLVWNLFLAWVPYFLSLLIWYLSQKGWSLISLSPILLVWLLFFPNAAYIITDFLHLRYRAPIPMWYDLLLIFSFAWTGLVLSHVSLRHIHELLLQYFNELVSWLLIIACLALTGFGIFVGRFQRWNSWDILSHPMHIVEDMMAVLLQPTDHLRTFGLAVVLFVFLLIFYISLHFLSTSKAISHD